MQLEEISYELKTLESGILDLIKSFDLPALADRIGDLNQQTLLPDFYEDRKKSQEILKEIKQLIDKKTDAQSLKNALDDCKTYLELAQETGAEDDCAETEKLFLELGKTYEKMRLFALLNGPYDANNCIINIHPGAGGTEAQDWAEMLVRMYMRWAEKRGYSVKTLDYLQGIDGIGIKNVTLELSGRFVYGYAKAEKGVHRLVRISPFDASGRRHTSFAAVEVMPEMDEDLEVEINEADLRVDTYRASGAGGQHINKTDSAVRITHLPTNTVVSCQSERSQKQNRETAMKMLKAKLLELAEQQQAEKIEDIKGVQKEIAWGSQIRSYVFCPYTMVKDHRTNFETGNVQAVMDGEIDGFINAFLQAQ